MGRAVRWAAAILVIAFSATIGSGRVEARPPLVRAEVESNDTAATATPLPLIGGYEIATGSIGTPGDVDVWWFRTSFGQHVWILCDTGGPQAGNATSRDAVMFLRSGDGRFVEFDDNDGTGTGGDTSIETGDSPAIAANLLQSFSGTYYIEIAAASPTAIVNPYRLLVVVTHGSGIEVEEAVTPIVGPQVIGVRQGVILEAGDVDSYSVKASAGDVLFVAASGDPNRDNTPTDLAVDVLAPDGSTVLLNLDSSESTALPPAEAAALSISIAGTYLIRVRHTDPTGVGAYSLMAAVSPFSSSVADFDGDRQTDVAVYRGTTGEWFIWKQIAGLFRVNWGTPSADDIPVPADYDGDGKTDIATYRNTTGQWSLRTDAGATVSVDWGAPWFGDKPVPQDYDGDGKADIAVYRSSTSGWFIRYSSGGTDGFEWGVPWLDDLPVPADYDGDGRVDAAVFRNTTGRWLIRFSGGGSRVVDWGAPWLGDIPAPGDYDGDGKADVAVYRSSTSDWFFQYSSGGTAWYRWGSPRLHDIPIPADYDSDGKTDIAIYRDDPDFLHDNSAGFWFVYSPGVFINGTRWGSPPLGDIPLSRPIAVW